MLSTTKRELISIQIKIDFMVICMEYSGSFRDVRKKLSFICKRDYFWFLIPNSDFGPYFGLFRIDCMVDSRILKSPKGRADLSALPKAESVKSLFRF